MVALCRSIGIPAKYQGKISYNPATTKHGAHVWTWIYIDNKWVVSDTENGDYVNDVGIPSDHVKKKPRYDTYNYINTNQKFYTFKMDKCNQKVLKNHKDRGLWLYNHLEKIYKKLS